MPPPTLPVVPASAGQQPTRPVQIVDDVGNSLHPGQPLAAPAALAASIGAGASLSASIDLGDDNRFAGLQLPATWTAAVITLQGSHDGVTFADIYTSGIELSLPAAISRMILVDRNMFAGVRYIKVRSGTGTVPVLQVALVSLQILRLVR